MKKILAIILAALFILGCFAGCGSKAYDSAAPEAGYNYKGDYDMPVDAPSATTDSANGTGAVDSDALMSTLTSQTASNLSEKIIYTAHAEIQTIYFDDTVNEIYRMIDGYNGFIESSYVSGSTYADTYYGRQTYRYADFVIRVPKENFDSMKEALPSLGSVTSISHDSQNITEQYTDTESRLTTYRTEEERLLLMLSKAETVEDMLAIESSLSNVRYEIESLTSALKNWDNRINYSTITLSINEVKEIEEPTELHRTYWEEISDGFKASLENVGEFFTDLFKGIIIALPVLIPLAIFIVVLIFIFSKLAKRRRERKANSPIKEKRRKIRKSKKNSTEPVVNENSDAIE